MSTALQTTNPADTFREQAAQQLHAVADMSLHELVDEFQRLSLLIEAGKIEGENYTVRWTPEAELATKQRAVVNGACKARFGLFLQTHDRDDPEGF